MVEKPDLDSLIAKWQSILRLQDYDFEICYKAADDMHNGSLAEIDVCIERNLATIHVADPEDRPIDGQKNRDIEADVVHEMLHVHFEPLSRGRHCLENRFLERTVDMISQILVRMDRVKRGDSNG